MIFVVACCRLPKAGGIPLSAFPQDTASEQTLHISIFNTERQAGIRGIQIFSLSLDPTRESNPRLSRQRLKIYPLGQLNGYLQLFLLSRCFLCRSMLVDYLSCKMYQIHYSLKLSTLICGIRSKSYKGVHFLIPIESLQVKSDFLRPKYHVWPV